MKGGGCEGGEGGTKRGVKKERRKKERRKKEKREREGRGRRRGGVKERKGDGEEEESGKGKKEGRSKEGEKWRSRGGRRRGMSIIIMWEEVQRVKGGEGRAEGVVASEPAVHPPQERAHERGRSGVLPLPQ
jgi:hypothetical protein